MYKIIIFLITSAAVLATDVMFSYGQTIAIGGRFTTSVVPSVAVVNPSPSNIYGPLKLNINAGVYALKYFKNSRMGVKAGLETGGVPFGVGVNAPRSAFGKGGNDDRPIGTLLSTNAFTYKALTLSAAYKLPVKKRFIEFTAGPSVRHYGYGKGGGYNEIMFAFNRSVPYDPDDPSAGPPDVRARVTNLNVFHVSFPVSVDYVVRASKRSQVKFGIMHNIAKPLPGELEVMMYGKTYQGSFRPRTGFWGFNVQYERLSKKSAESYKRHVAVADTVKKFRKAVFIETYIKPGLLSANYDMRLKKSTNSGIGFTAGLGFGGHYYTDATNNNRTDERRMLALPVAINYIIGGKQHGIELGIGVTPQIGLDNARNNSAESDGTFFPLRIGYRFQPIREGLVVRAAWLPIAKKPTRFFPNGYDLFNFGVSFGYSFK